MGIRKKLVKFSKFKKNKIENLKINAYQISKKFSKNEFLKKISKIFIIFLKKIFFRIQIGLVIKVKKFFKVK